MAVKAADRSEEMGEKWRKKPIVVEAIQLTWDNWAAICEFVTKDAFIRGCWLDENGEIMAEGETRFVDGEGAIGLLLATLEGTMLARGGDWIIRGVKGEFYPCKPDIFEATYERAHG